MEMLYLVLISGSTILTLVILGTLAWGGISAAPWVPLWKKDTIRLLEVAKVQPGELVIDLGAGDARIIIEATRKYQAQAIGYEVAILPYFIGWVRIMLLGLGGKTALKYRNFFKEDLSQADVICAFLTPAAMAKLKPKLEKEAKAGCRIVSYAFHIPDWQPTKVDKPNQKTTAIYLYQR